MVRTYATKIRQPQNEKGLTSRINQISFRGKVKKNLSGYQSIVKTRARSILENSVGLFQTFIGTQKSPEIMRCSPFPESNIPQSYLNNDFLENIINPEVNDISMDSVNISAHNNLSKSKSCQQSSQKSTNCSSDFSFKFKVTGKVENTFDRLFRKSDERRRNNPPLSKAYNTDENHRVNLSYPSSVESSSIQTSTEDTDKGEQFALFQSLEEHTDVVQIIKTSNVKPSTIKQKTYRNKMSIKRNEANKSICKSTLEHVVEDVMEGVKELDIADSTQKSPIQEGTKPGLSKRSNRLVDSKSLTTNLERTGLVQKETGTLSVFSPSGFTSPGNVPDIKSYKKIQMVTSTPLLKTSESAKINENRLLQESEVNSLFHAGSSAVKHYSNNIRTDRLRITPNANFSAKNNVKDILPDSPTLPIMKNNESTSSNTKHHSLSKESLAPAEDQINLLNRNDNSLVEIPQIVVEPKTLRFEISPEKPKSKVHSSIDMFENLSMCNEVQNQISSKENGVKDNIVDDASIKITGTDHHSIKHASSLNSDSLVHKQTKTNNVQFKVPNVVSQPSLIPIKKGGKNWRRTMVLPPTIPTFNEKLSNLTRERKSIARKSFFKIEPRRSRTTLDNIQTSQINEISIMDVSASDNNFDRKKVPIEHSNLLFSESSSSLNKSLITNKSSSYIVPYTEKHSTSILALSNIDIQTKVLSKCSENRIVSFDQLCNQQVLKNSKKVGEGSYGEVFLLNFNELNSSVLKIVPVDGNCPVNGEPQTKLSDMLAEIVVSTDLNLLQKGFFTKEEKFQAPNFIGLRNCTLVEGQYPERLLELWDEYDENKGSENERPDANLFNVDANTETQRFVALEYENGGEDLENIVINNSIQGLSIFLQVAFSVAVAEKAFEFEHRDLHWGNILVRKTTPKNLSYTLGEDFFELKSGGVDANIIDFSLSRMTTIEERCEIYNNLAEDPNLFICEGQEHDPPGDYQFDIYRMMQNHTNEDWKGFYPKTNIFWLHYLLDKIINEVKYRNKKSSCHRKGVLKLRKLKDRILDFDSCQSFVRWYDAEYNSN